MRGLHGHRTHCNASPMRACSWRLVEAAQGIPNALPSDKGVLGGQNEAAWLAQQAKAQGFTVMRLFGIADINWGEGSALQTSPGAQALCSI